MIERVILQESEYKELSDNGDYSDKLKFLLKLQFLNWELLRQGYKSLDSVSLKSFEFEDFTIKVQFNPGRILSSAAKVDEQSVRERKCFLCPENLPSEQRGILYDNDFLLLCNPFPIFNEHFTLANINHFPQRIYDNFSKFLSLTQDLGREYTLFYNGPKCGASAPDHMHFQCGNKYFLPIESELDLLTNSHGTLLFENREMIIYKVEDGLRRFFVLKSNEKKPLIKVFKNFYSSYKRISSDKDEPMMNIIGFYLNDYWSIVIFPRARHRSSHYFAEGQDNLLLSPASVDLGGVLITPLEKDFNKISKDLITDVIKQVCLEKEYFEYLIKEFQDLT